MNLYYVISGDFLLGRQEGEDEDKPTGFWRNTPENRARLESRGYVLYVLYEDGSPT